MTNNGATSGEERLLAMLQKAIDDRRRGVQYPTCPVEGCIARASHPGQCVFLAPDVSPSTR